MPLSSGTLFGPYEILVPIGAGGMGEVYRARDSRLGRDVALKILPASFATDTDRLRRFEQEARSVAALNHPNILAVYDIGQQDGAPYLVSELLEGESLRAVLDGGAMPQRKAIESGVQIAHGLAAAHDRGIVHRDLKPENIFVLRDGRIKILDFGLAKLAETKPAASDATMAQSHTSAGTVLGTAGYMAPEQVRGEAVDARTDIFAFGAVLYEMLSGVRAFKKDTAVETMTAVMREDPPDLAATTSGTAQPISPALDRIVRRCLEKSPEQRFQSAKDLSFALSSLSGNDTTTSSRAAAVAAAETGSRWNYLRGGLGGGLGWLGIAAALLMVAGLTWWLARRETAATERMQFAIAGTEEMSISHMALTVDGTKLAFIAPDPETELPMVWVQRVGSAAIAPVAGTLGASYPFWSPDNRFIGYFANSKLWKIATEGGTPQELGLALSGRGGSWGSQNVIIFAPNADTGLYRVNPDGSGLAAVTVELQKRFHADNHRWPLFLPDGKHFLYWSGSFAMKADDQVSGIYVSDLAGKEQRLVQLCHSNFGFDQHHFYFADDHGQLLSAPFDLDAVKVTGEPVVVAKRIGYQPGLLWAALTVSENGTVVYNPGIGASISLLTWIDRTGKVLGTLGTPGVQANPTISPDGTRVTVDIADTKSNNVDVWLKSTAGLGDTRFTFDPAEDVAGVWSPDGKQIAWRSVPDTSVLFVKPANGLAKSREIARLGDSDDLVPSAWTLDGNQVLATYQTDRESLMLFDVASGARTPVLASKDSNQTNGQFSPDGRWLVYDSDESGDWEVYVTSFPALSGKWQISRGGGTEPRWSKDGKEIFYIATSGFLNAVPVSAAEGFSSGTPVPLFQVHGRAPVSTTDMFTYDVAADGQRFLVNRYVKPEHIAPLTILLNGPGR
jgi:Tol biopolymer transport system component